MKKVLVFVLVLFISLFVSVGLDRNVVCAEDSSGYAYAVLTADGDLIFFRSLFKYDDNYTGNVSDISGNTYTGKAYSDVENKEEKWLDSTDSLKVKRVVSFEDQRIKFPSDISGWFYGCSNMTSFYADGFDTSQVNNMELLFSGCSNLISLDLGVFNTRNVTNMSSMFSNCSSLESIGLSSFNTCNVINMYGMFHGCRSLKSVDLDSFDTGSVKNMVLMFSDCSSLVSIDLTKFDTNNVSNMTLMFSGCTSLRSIDLSSFDTSTVTDISSMFDSCYQLEFVDISNFDTRSCTSNSSIFSYCNNLRTVILGEYATKSTGNLPEGFWANYELGIKVIGEEFWRVTNRAGKWTRENGREYAVLTQDGDLVFLRSTEKANDTGSQTITDLNGNKYKGIIFDVFNKNEYSTFSGWLGNYSLDVENVYVAEGQVVSPCTMRSWFYNCSNLKSFDGRGFDTSNVISMERTFQFCSNLSTLNFEGFDTGKVSDMSYLFYGCRSIASIDLSEFNTSSVSNMSGMFAECSALSELDTTDFDTSRLTSINGMFSGCTSLVELDLSSFCTSNVTDMSFLFSYCPSLTILDLSSFDTSRCTDRSMKSMFSECDSLNRVLLGKGFTQWHDYAYLPEGQWVNSNINLKMNEIQLYESYPDHAEEWAGEWVLHIHCWSVFYSNNDATCLLDGTKTRMCEICGDQETVVDVNSAFGHKWDKPEYSWANDYSSVTAKTVCINDPNHVIEESSKTVIEVIKEASTEDDGWILVTASFNNDLFSAIAKTVTIPRIITYKIDFKKFANTSNGIIVQWNKVEDPELLNYSLFRSETGKNQWTLVKDNLTETNITDTAVEVLESGRNYDYKVVVTKTSGNTYEGIRENWPYIGVTVMNAPTCTRAGIRVTWPKVEGATKYVVMRSIGAGAPNWKYLTTVNATDDAVQKFDTKAGESGSWYAYTVRAVYSDEATGEDIYGGQPGGRSILYRAPVKVVKAVNVSKGVRVTFRTVGAGYTYRLYRSEKVNGSWTSYEKVTDLVKAYTGTDQDVWIHDETAENGHTYKYYVRCVSKDGKVPLSSYDNEYQIIYNKL